MKIDKRKQKIEFGPFDMNFLAEFGVERATDMVFDYKYFNKTPFIYDVYQLSNFLGTSLKAMFKIVNKHDEMYKKIQIPKRSGGIRTIYEPNEELKCFQRKINREILSKIPVSEYATAYKKESSLYKNALPHANKEYILKMDITDFFSNIYFFDILKCVFNSSIYPKNIGCMLTAICCKDDCLPQGAPTSPAISNIVMKHFDDVMGEWCKNRNIGYTRYCDDITFSGGKEVYSAFFKAKRTLENMEFEINEKKTRIIKNTNRQTVTGIVVNEHPQLSKEYRRKLRQEIYYVKRFGVADALEHISGRKPNAESIYSYYSQLMSKIAYVLQIDPNNKEFLEHKKNLKSDFDEYYGIVGNDRGYKYLGYFENGHFYIYNRLRS